MSFDITFIFKLNAIYYCLFYTVEQHMDITINGQGIFKSRFIETHFKTKGGPRVSGH